MSDLSRRHILRVIAPYAVLLLGLGLRFAMVPDARFTGDESNFFQMAQGIADGDASPDVGPPVSGSKAHHPGPSFYYLMAIPNALGDNPLYSGFFVALLSILGLALLVRIVRGTRGEGPALITAWLCALSPWFVLYADRIWNSNVAPWLGIIVVYGLWRMREVEKSWWAAPTVATLMVLFQFHLSAPILWAGAVVFLLVCRPRVRLAAVGLGFAVGFLLYWPYLQSELASGFANSHAILTAGTGGAESQGIRPALRSLLYLPIFSTGDIGYHFNTGYWRPYDPFLLFSDGPTLKSHLAWYGWPLALAVIVSWCASLLGWTRGLADLFRGKEGRLSFFRDPFWCLLVVGGIAAAGLLWWTQKPCYPHYNNLLLPLAIVPTADGLYSLFQTRRLRNASIILILMLGIAFTLITSRYYDRVDSKVGVTTSLAITELITDTVGTHRFSVHYRRGEFNNAHAMGILSREVLKRPWNRVSRARRRFTVMPRGDDPNFVRIHEQLWEMGPMWVVVRNR